MMDTVAWLVVALVMFIGEMLCPIFFMFWFGIGALIALVVSLITSNIIVQAAVFLAVSVLLVIFTKPLTDKFFKNKTKDELNINGIIGKIGLVTKPVNNLDGTGEVKLHGESWRAIAENDNDIIEEGEQVEVLKIDGVKLIVKKSESVKNNN